MAEEREARLYVLAGPDLARSFALGERATLGRSDECDVVLRDRSISRKHAVLSRAGDGWVVEDNGSTNGVSKDGKRAQRIELADGDEFKLGDLPLRVRWSAAADAQEIEFVDGPAAKAPVTAPKAPATAPKAPPPVPERARAPQPAAAPEIDDEIEIEEAVEIEIEGPDSPSAPARREAASALREPGLAAPRFERSERSERRTGLLTADLEQQPFWMRCLLALLVLALGAGLAYGAYRVVLLVREGL